MANDINKLLKLVKGIDPSLSVQRTSKAFKVFRGGTYLFSYSLTPSDFNHVRVVGRDFIKFAGIPRGAIPERMR